MTTARTTVCSMLLILASCSTADDGGECKEGGAVVWEIRDRDSGVFLASGRTIVPATEVEVEAVLSEDLGPGLGSYSIREVHYDRQVGVTEDLVIGMSSHPTEKAECPPSGFGMWLKHKEERTFSWEWFYPAGEGLARKLQGGGDLSISCSSTAYGFEIVETTFLSDTVFRAELFDEGETFDPFGPEPKWTLVVHEGSRICWD